MLTYEDVLRKRHEMQQMEESEWNVVPSTTETLENNDSSSNIKASEKCLVSTDAVDKLAKGLVSLYLTDLEKVSQSLEELKQNQNILIETIQQENEKYNECHNAYDINGMFSQIKSYHAKLINMKKEMKMIQEKSQKLKFRAQKLRLQKEEENNQRRLKQQQELEKELKILAKPASSSSSSSTMEFSES